VAGLALALLIVYGSLTFFGRVAIQLRRTGETGLIGLRPGAGPVDWLSGILFLGGIVLGTGSIILVLSGTLDPIDALDVGALHVIGIVLATAGGLAVFAAQLGMGESWRIGVPEEESLKLITGGWFSVIRNPIYTAMIVGWLGFALMVPTWLGFAAVPVTALALELQVRAVEEPYLLRTHGDAYRAYASRVGRFVPGVGRLAAR
jgi:protein-S-isoprenylcysteine O-methyltransferase Ste14